MTTLFALTVWQLQGSLNLVYSNHGNLFSFLEFYSIVGWVDLTLWTTLGFPKFTNSRTASSTYYLFLPSSMLQYRRTLSKSIKWFILYAFFPPRLGCVQSLQTSFYRAWLRVQNWAPPLPSQVALILCSVTFCTPYDQHSYKLTYCNSIAWLQPYRLRLALFPICEFN